MDNQEYRIGIVDDHPAILLGVQALLSPFPDLRVAATATSVASLVQRDTPVDIVLLDLSLGDGSTPSTNMRGLREKWDVPVLIFTSAENPDLLRSAARSGAVGLLKKSAMPQVAAATIRAAIKGESLLSMEWASALGGDVEFASAELSTREKEILHLYSSGMTADAVAETLFISRATVYDHVRRIRGKYQRVDRDVSTKIGLRERAIEDGLL